MNSQPAEHINPLPAELRDNLLQLSLFVDRQTLTALGDPIPMASISRR